ncbi:MAG: ABC transporter permease [Actinomycetota bacterium]
MSSQTATITAARPGGGLLESARARAPLGARETRLSLRNPEVFIPNLILPVVLFFIFVGSLSGFAQAHGMSNYRGFFLPLSILFAVSWGSAGLNMAADIQSGYFDKLLATPVSRVGLLVGALSADLVRVTAQGLLTATVAMAVGTEIATGVLGAVVMVLVASVFGLAFSALGFSVALRTADPQATKSLFDFVLPLFLVTTSFAPMETLSGWFATAAKLNPVTYVFRGLRSLTLTGWDAGEIGIAVATAGGLAAGALALAFASLRARVR